MITLLEIYRGGEIYAPANAIQFLQNQGLITRAFLNQSKIVICPKEGDSWTITAKGRTLVEKVLGEM